MIVIMKTGFFNTFLDKYYKKRYTYTLLNRLNTNLGSNIPIETVTTRRLFAELLTWTVSNPAPISDDRDGFGKSSRQFLAYCADSTI